MAKHVIFAARNDNTLTLLYRTAANKNANCQPCNAKEGNWRQGHQANGKGDAKEKKSKSKSKSKDDE
jgi:hypothetical protein